MCPKFQLRYRQCFRCGSFLPTAYADISCEMFVYLKTNQDKVLPLKLVRREENYNILVVRKFSILRFFQNAPEPALTYYYYLHVKTCVL